MNFSSFTLISIYKLKKIIKLSRLTVYDYLFCELSYTLKTEKKYLEKYFEKSIDISVVVCYNNKAVILMYELLAQLAEHLTFNQRVRGSNPR